MCHLYRAALQEGTVQLQSPLHGGRLQEFHVREALGTTRVFITQDGDSIDGSTALKVGLELFWCHFVVDLTDVAGGGRTGGREGRRVGIGKWLYRNARIQHCG